MKKQYVFLSMILLILYIWYLIINFTYKEYKINSHIEYISNLNLEIEKKINTANDIIKFKTSKAYKNKILKEQQSFKNKWELVIYLTSEAKYKKFTTIIDKEIQEQSIETENIKDKNVKWMTIFQKWIYLIFKKDLSL